MIAPFGNTTFEIWRPLLTTCLVRIQWDPERDWRLRKIEDARAIQIGLSGEAVERYVHDWITAIEDVTPLGAYDRAPSPRGHAAATWARSVGAGLPTTA